MEEDLGRENKMNKKIFPNPTNLNRPRLAVVLFTIFLNIFAVMIFANVSWSDWRTGMALNLLDNSIFITYAIRWRDQMMKHLLLFGLALGLTELLADAWIVDVTHTLDYSIGGGPMLWRSPLWMPFAWEVVAVQFAVLGQWLTDKWKGIGLILTGLAGAINIPFYEEMALQTNWWLYRNCRMFLHTPYYIILGEFLIVIGIVILSRKLQPPRLSVTLFTGMLGGLVIFASYALAFWICEF